MENKTKTNLQALMIINPFVLDVLQLSEFQEEFLDMISKFAFEVIQVASPVLWIFISYPLRKFCRPGFSEGLQSKQSTWL